MCAASSLHYMVLYTRLRVCDTVGHIPHCTKSFVGLQVLSELRTYRRTTSTDELESPMSDSPGFIMNMRASSLIALGISPASPRSQRQFIASGKRQTPAKMHGAKQLEQTLHASSSRLPALAGHAKKVAVAAKDNDDPGRGGVATRNGGKHCPSGVLHGRSSTHASNNAGKHRPSRSPPNRLTAAEDSDCAGVGRRDGGKHLLAGVHDGRSTHASRNAGKHRPSRSPPLPLARAAGRIKLIGRHDSQPSAAESPPVSDSDLSRQNASSSSAVPSCNEEEVQGEDSGQEGWVPSPIGKGNLRVNLRVRLNKQDAGGTRAGEAQVKDDNAPSDEEEWTGSPVTRSRRSLKVKSGLRKSSVSTNSRVLAARRATVGGRKRSDKLSNFSGVTLKNGRCVQ